MNFPISVIQKVKQPWYSVNITDLEVLFRQQIIRRRLKQDTALTDQIDMNLFNFCVSYDIRLLKAVVGSYDYNVITLLDLLGVVYVVEDLAVLILNRLDVVRVNGLGKIILIEFLILTVVVSIVDLFVSIVIDLDKLGLTPEEDPEPVEEE